MSLLDTMKSAVYDLSVQKFKVRRDRVWAGSKPRKLFGTPYGTVDYEKACEDIGRLYRKGHTTTELSRLAGVCRATICKVVRSQGLRLRHVGRKKGK